ncbi:retrovirus-related pol polyprotein from transposon TNT 1-94 [Tanacetum coccineum]
MELRSIPVKEIVTLPHRDKLELRGLKCVLLGYPSNSKGYTLYDLNTKQVSHSRDVVCEENFFPFKAQLVPSSDKARVFPTFCSFDESDVFPLTNENIEPQQFTTLNATPEQNVPEVTVST